MTTTEDTPVPEKAKGATKKRARQKRMIFSKVEIVGINTLIPYWRNARRGDVEVIRQSLRENGMYKPLVVNEGTKTGRHREILGGNHTWLAAKAESWLKVGVIWVDVDDTEAAKINLIDNRANDVASYDTDILAAQLKDLPDISGTGYSDEDAQAVISSIDTGDVESLVEVIRPTAPMREIQSDPFDDLDDVEGGGSYVTEAEDNDAGIDFRHDIDDTLGGVVQLSKNMEFKFTGDWHFPQWMPEMLVRPEDLPDNLAAWAGSATKYDPVTDLPSEDQWWLYNFGIDSTSGMRDISQMIMSFYAFDEYWECWWDFPERYTTKMINSGVTMAVTPNFSTWTDFPRIQSFWNTYRGRWLGRYFQEAGIKIIPNFEWPWGDKWFLENCVLGTLNKGATFPLISLQMQTKQEEDEEVLDNMAEEYHTLIDRVQPEEILLYASQKGLEFWQTLGITTPIRFVEHRMTALAQQAKNRKKKTTL
jgi:hypothetical protein